MPSTPLKVLLPQVQGAQLAEVFCAQTGKFIEQLRQRLPLNLSNVSLTIKGFKRPGFAELQYRPGSRHPIGAFRMGQVTEDVERIPGGLTLIPEGPRLRQVTQQRIESGGGSREQRQGVLKAMLHHVLDSQTAKFQRL
jgi:hypothetical protein